MKIIRMRDAIRQYHSDWKNHRPDIHPFSQLKTLDPETVSLDEIALVDAGMSDLIAGLMTCDECSKRVVTLAKFHYCDDHFEENEGICLCADCLSRGKNEIEEVPDGAR